MADDAVHGGSGDYVVAGDGAPVEDCPVRGEHEPALFIAIDDHLEPESLPAPSFDAWLRDESDEAMRGTLG